MKTNLVSGIRPTGQIHIGNYAGAIAQFLKYQDHSNYDCYYFVADMHGLTEVQNRTQLSSLSVEAVRMYLACGLYPNKNTIYRQSDIVRIPAISLLLSMITSEGLLRRCTTFKDKKAAKEKANHTISAGLLNYPILMTADIVAVGATEVPVGEDQLQHLEMARDILVRANNMFGLSLPLPKCPADYNPLRLPGLDGSGKMGKSDGNVINLLDSEEKIRKTVKAAVTDCGSTPDGTMSPALTNLFKFSEVFCSSEEHHLFLQRHNDGHQNYYGEFKDCIGNALVKLIAPIRERYYHDPACNEDAALAAMSDGAEKANLLAEKVYGDIASAMNI